MRETAESMAAEEGKSRVGANTVVPAWIDSTPGGLAQRDATTDGTVGPRSLRTRLRIEIVSCGFEALFFDVFQATEEVEPGQPLHFVHAGCEAVEWFAATCPAPTVSITGPAKIGPVNTQVASA